MPGPSKAIRLIVDPATWPALTPRAFCLTGVPSTCYYEDSTHAKEANMPKMNPAERFFYEHAGYATPPGRVACAKALAKAEAKALLLGLTLTLEPDGEVYAWQ